MPMKAPHKKPEKHPLKTIILVNAIGIDFGLCVVIGYFAGDFLQSRFGGALWLLLGLGLGIAAGVWSAALIIKRFIGA